MDHGVRFPWFRKELVNGETFEELSFSLEEAFQHGYKQTLAEPAWPTQKFIFAVSQKRLDIGSLVEIHVSLSSNIAKRLQTNWKFHLQSMFPKLPTVILPSTKLRIYLHSAKLSQKNIVQFRVRTGDYILFRQ